MGVTDATSMFVKSRSSLSPDTCQVIGNELVAHIQAARAHRIVRG